MNERAAITLDTDWAPDFVIDDVAARLVRGRVRATWFVTHASAAIDRLRQHDDLFELGIHPNFLPGSSHGSTPEEILATCLRLVPGATSMRTHGLVQSTRLLEAVLERTPIETDVSLLLPRMTHAAPVEYWWKGKMLLRVPYVWEDDVEIECPDPIWDVDRILATPGVKVFNFHPIHVYLNSSTLGAYNALKQRQSAIANATIAEVSDLVEAGEGAGTAFDMLVARLRGEGCCVSDFKRRHHSPARAR